MLSPLLYGVPAALPSPFTSNGLALYAILAFLSFLALQYIYLQLQTPLRFIWNCFFKPISSKTGKQSERLDSFYQNQADLYDATRGGLLKGRTQMLELVASHLRVQNRALAGGKAMKKLIWVDVGGGSGWNIEKMDQFMSIKDTFEAVYLVDLCEPLLAVARKRFERKGWTNVHCLHQDASEFLLPSWTSSTSPIDPRGSVDLVTLSYSLSMIPSYHAVLDRVEGVLNPSFGLLGVVDFFTSEGSGTARERAIGSARRKCSWLSKWFWEIWFSFDHVHLSESRRNYLEYKFGTIKSYNGRNGFILPFLIQIPFYVNISVPRSRDITRLVRALNTQTGSSVGQASPVLMSPLQRPISSSSSDDNIPSLSLGGNRAASLAPSTSEGSTVVHLGIPASSFHYQAKGLRVPYLEEKVHDEFRSHVYGFTWEDPVDDLRHLNLTKDDSMLIITSAGDNALHYAAAAGPKRIHCVDMNPCQGHILELKLAGIQALDHDEFFALFGLGKVPNFQALLDGKLAPYLSSHAYQYWSIHAHYFKNNFHMHGYSGMALRFAHAAFQVAGLTNVVKEFATASNIHQQDQIYKQQIRPFLTNPILVKILSSPVFLWNALGVPINQANCLLKDGSIQDFVLATFDPIPKMGCLSKGAYHYLLCLLGRYTPESCPLYLTRSGFEKLKQAELSSNDSAFRLHTESIYAVLASQPSQSLTKIILMDSMDWFDPIPSSTPLPLSHDPSLANALFSAGLKPEPVEKLRSSLDHQILELKRVLVKGGEVYWRSAGKRPFYVDRFEMAGFKVTPISVRANGKGIDRVNMYASFWVARV